VEITLNNGCFRKTAVDLLKQITTGRTGIKQQKQHEGFYNAVINWRRRFQTAS
jgi:hypothetical protein